MRNRRWLASTLAVAALSACGDQSATAPTHLTPERALAAITPSATGPITITSGLSAVQVSVDGITWYPAISTASNPAWGAPVNGGSYIASFANAGSTGPDGITRSTYKSSFTLPEGAVSPKVTVSAYADNWAAVSLNGKQFGSMIYFTTYGDWALNFGGSMYDGFGGPKPGAAQGANPFAFQTTSGFVIGANTLSFALENWGGPEGLSFSATVTYDAKYINGCAKVRDLVSHNGTANSLCAKLYAAAASELAGNLSAKAGTLGAYANEVNAQAGKFIPTANVAAVLAIGTGL